MPFSVASKYFPHLSHFLVPRMSFVYSSFVTSKTRQPPKYSGFWGGIVGSCVVGNPVVFVTGKEPSIFPPFFCMYGADWVRLYLDFSKWRLPSDLEG